MDRRGFLGWLAGAVGAMLTPLAGCAEKKPLGKTKVWVPNEGAKLLAAYRHEATSLDENGFVVLTVRFRLRFGHGRVPNIVILPVGPDGYVFESAEKTVSLCGRNVDLKGIFREAEKFPKGT